MFGPSNEPTNDKRRHFLRESLILAGTVPVALTGSIAQSAGQRLRQPNIQPLRLGVLGCGRRAMQLAKAALGSASVDVQLVALADLFPDRVQQFYRSLNGQFSERVHLQSNGRISGLRAAQQLADCDVDVVMVAAAPAFRGQHVQCLIEAGKHVYAERPVGADIDSIQLLADSARMARLSNLALQIGLQHRHQRYYSEAVDQIHSGLMGAARLARIELTVRPERAAQQESKRRPRYEQRLRNWQLDPELSGGVVVEKLSASLDLINWIMQSAPFQAFTIGDSEDQSILYSYPCGARLECCIKSGNTCRNHHPSHLVQGSEGWCDLDRGQIFNQQNQLVWSATGPQPDSLAAVERFLSAVYLSRFQPKTAMLPVEVDAGIKSTRAAILGRVALQSPGRVVKWDDILAGRG